MALSTQAKNTLLAQIQAEEELPIERITAVLGGKKPEDTSILFRPCRLVELTAEGLENAQTTIVKMGTVLKHYRELTGIGRALAANQIASDLSIVVFLHPDGHLIAYINPKIIWKSQEENIYWEVCLSGAPLGVDVQRPEKAKVEWYDEAGAEHQELLEGFDARRMQHEIDHLHGKVCYNTDGTHHETLGYGLDAETYLHQELRVAKKTV